MVLAVKTGVVNTAVADNKFPNVGASYHSIVSPASKDAVKVVVPLQITLFPEITGALYL